MLKDIPVSLYSEYFATGSNVICNPPVTDTDLDFMIFTDEYDAFVEYLTNNKWEFCGGEEYNYKDNNWCALRKGNLNYLITQDINHYTKFKEATELATKMNLLIKDQRVILFNYIMNGEF